MEYQMKLTPEQQEILNGSRGETMAKVMQTLIRYGELFGADEMVPVTSKYNHLVTSFGLKALGPVYHLSSCLMPVRFLRRSFLPTRVRWIRRFPAAFCKTLCLIILCIQGRTTMKSSWASSG